VNIGIIIRMLNYLNNTLLLVMKKFGGYAKNVEMTGMK